MADLFLPTLDDLIDCVDRELRLRAIVYPRRVTDKRMSQAKADREMELMRAIRAVLEELKADREMELIRAIRAVLEELKR